MLLYIILLALGIVFLLTALVLLIKPVIPAAIAAYVSLWVLHWSHFISLPDSTLLFWGMATAIVFGLFVISPKSDNKSISQGAIYMSVATVGGLLIGMSIGAAYMILGAVIGTFVGEFAYARTPQGKWLKFPSSIFIHYFCAKGLQIIVTVAMIGIALEGFILN